MDRESPLTLAMEAHLLDNLSRSVVHFEKQIDIFRGIRSRHPGASQGHTQCLYINFLKVYLGALIGMQCAGTLIWRSGIPGILRTILVVVGFCRLLIDCRNNGITSAFCKTKISSKFVHLLLELISAG